MSDRCVFCEILRGNEPASFTYQDDTVVAFMDVQPITHGHMLVVPREHAVLMADVNETVFQDVPHFHVHVIPRYANDGFGLTFPNSYSHPPSRAELETIAAAIHPS